MLVNTQLKVPIKTIAKIEGTLISMTIAIPYSLHHFHSLTFAKEKALQENQRNFKAFASLSVLTLSDLEWWENFHGPYEKSFIPLQPHAVLATDASLEGWGATFSPEAVAGVWSDGDFRFINEKELHAVWNALIAFDLPSSNQCLKLQVDNMTAQIYLKKGGGRKAHLNF